MITLTAADSQIVLYAKGHFGWDRPNQVEDCRILVATRAGMDPQHISDRDVVAVLMMILETLNLKLDAKFIQTIVFGDYCQKGKSPVENFVYAALLQMIAMSVRDASDNLLVDIWPLEPNALSAAVPA